MRAGVRITLACAPVDVGPVLRDALFSKGLGVVLTSATLSTKTVQSRPGGIEVDSAKRRVSRKASTDADGPAFTPITGFTHTTRRLGCDDARTLQVGSPFDFARQARIYVDTRLPAPGSPTYAARVAARIAEHARETDGGVLVLCTSLSFIDELTRAVEPELARRQVRVLAQERDGPRGQILDEFRRSGRAVLIGAASFWQGVDIPGHALRCVVITRLPFDPPDRPLTAARLERISALGGDPFKDESLPRAVIRFKQGFGRLIRTATDTGRVVVLDPRIVSTWYGRFFLSALPPGIPLVDQATEGADARFLQTESDQI